jgi:hypothetical protein
MSSATVTCACPVGSLEPEFRMEQDQCTHMSEILTAG